MPATKVRDITGPGITTAYGIGGTDLGAPRLSPDGSRLVLVFGDSFSGNGLTGDWRTPTALFADPSSVRSGLRWTGAAGGSSYAKQLVPAPHNSTIRGFYVTTQLPTDVITIGGSMYLQVMACEGLGNVHFCEIYRSDDQGDTWYSTGCWWSGGYAGGLLQMLTWELGDDGYVYVFGTGFQRDKGLILYRVPAERIAQSGAWQPWGWTQATGWQWGNPATLVLPGKWGELSLRRCEGKWVLSGFDAAAYAITARYLNSPTDDLGRAPATTIVAGVGWDAEDQAHGKAAQIYGGFLLPGSTLSEQHYVVSQWNTSAGWPYHSSQYRLGGGSTQQQLLLN